MNIDNDFVKNDPNCFPITLKSFVNRFVPHNYVVNLYRFYRKRSDSDPDVWLNCRDLLWRGMNWQIVMPDEEWAEYHSCHVTIERCPYRDWWVQGITGCREKRDFDCIDTVSIDIEEDR